jgi:hypothetical protein
MSIHPNRTTVPDTSGHVRLTQPDSTGRTDKTCNVCLSGRQVSCPEGDGALSEWQSAPYRDDLGTIVNSLSYNFRTQTGRLSLPALCCTDMDGCIRLFTTIDSHVNRIETVVGNTSSTIYVREVSGWVARCPGRPMRDEARHD